MANIFRRSTNKVPLKLGLAFGVAVAMIIAAVWYYWTPKYTRVGYSPTQPVPFDHNLHANQLGMDCRYCHSFVETSPHATVPPTQTCMNCHGQIRPDSPKLAPIRESWATGKPVDWVKVHKLPDYVFFNHAVHVNRGVSCVSCHGQVNEMHQVSHVKPLSMAWCLECHRMPENHLRPRDQVFNLNWKPPAGTTQKEIGTKIKKESDVNPSINCAACHR